jgi:hypothetical protein
LVERVHLAEVELEHEAVMVADAAAKGFDQVRPARLQAPCANVG